MPDRRFLIEQVDSLIKECSNHVTNLLKYQQMKQNDARVTFFKHMNTVLDSAIISLILAHKYLGSLNLEAIHIEYELSPRLYDYDTERKYFDQIVMNGYFLFIFNEFEHSVRLICKQYNNQLFQTQASINALCKGVTKDLSLKKRYKFIDLITYLRNSFHNNGLFVPGGKLKSTKIVWNNTTYFFNEYRSIKESKGDIWLSFVPISKEIITFFNEIINSFPVKNLRYYHDPTEPIR